jgi:hypothetical protein
MKRLLEIALVSAMLSVPLFAGTNSQTFALPSDVRIGDTQVREGHCDVTWSQTSGSQVQLTIKTEDRKTIVVSARVVDEKQAVAAVQTFVANGVIYVREFDTKKARFIIQDLPTGTK